MNFLKYCKIAQAVHSVGTSAAEMRTNFMKVTAKILKNYASRGRIKAVFEIYIKESVPHVDQKCVSAGRVRG
ncbi:MAG TPA: hypothetical protein H9846_08955, partial [Candidatus Gemmiger excrementipullorum]|nr:hypothetical protein [Candidatus Gemmiger excrementipullorum]